MMICPFHPRCGMECESDAELFLHRQLHAEPYDPRSWNLGKLPCANFRAVSKLMQEYHEYQMSGEALSDPKKYRLIDKPESPVT